MLGDLFQDLRYGARNLRRSRGFATMVVLTLALGVGANTAMFSLLDAVLLRMLPVREPERLVQLSDGMFEGVTVDSVGHGRLAAFSSPLYDWFRKDEGARTQFDGIAAQQLNRTRAAVSWDDGRIPDDGQIANARLVSANFFEVVGVTAWRGRGFLPEDETAPGANPVVVLSHGYWQRRFGADPAALASEITVNSRRYRVIGIMPPAFTGPRLGEETDLWIPLTMQTALMGGGALTGDRKTWWLLAVGRLRPGITVPAAQAGANLVLQHFLAADPDVEPELARRVRLELTPGGHGSSSTRRDLRMPLVALMVGVGLLLLIVCLNVSHLLLARAVRRQREMGIRTALGATRGRLLRQALAEGLLLSLLGGVAAMLAAHFMIDGLLALGPGLAWVDVRVDGRLLAFTAALALATTVVLGLVPAWQASRGDLRQALHASAQTVTTGGRRRRASRLLLASQVAFSLVLLVGAGLMTATLARLRAQDRGFDGERVLLGVLMLNESGVSEQQVPLVHDEILRRVQALPGVQQASLSQGTGSLLRAGAWETDLYVPGRPRSLNALTGAVTPGYFQTMGIPLLRGRLFERSDGKGAPSVAVISETLARRAFGGVDAAVGKRLALSERDTRPSLEVVGVVADARLQGLRDAPQAAIYRPATQVGGHLRGLQVRAWGDPLLLAEAVRRSVREAWPGLPTPSVNSLVENIERRLEPERLLATLSSGFGLAALFLVCLGLYGVMSQWAGQRTREIGVRMALGASAGGVRWLVLRQALPLVAVGVALGLPAALALSRLMAGLLYGVSPGDPLTLGLAALLMFAVAAAAAYLPARRASRVDPMLALRSE